MRSGVQDQPGQYGETLPLLKIQKKISQVWWQAPVVPATREAEVGELRESGRQRLQIAPLHSSLGNRGFSLPPRYYDCGGVGVNRSGKPDSAASSSDSLAFGTEKPAFPAKVISSINGRNLLPD
ncbi:hypothetical protein AAY473_035257 [Plecturocebus cupreus]